MDSRPIRQERLFMSLTKTEVTKSLKALCKKYDIGNPNGTTFILLKTYFDMEKLTVLILSEKNEGQTINSSHVLKHQRVESIKHFLKDTKDSNKIFESLLPVMGDIADFINDYQIKRSRKKKKA